MPNIILSPNMDLPVPVVSVDPGPDWATNLNACLQILDQHTHSTGQGAIITPSGILINADFGMNDNNVIALRSLRFTSQGSPLSLAADLGCLYESGVDLYYNDGAGNQIRITQSGAISGAAGTITGLPSGTASASFSTVGGGTFTFVAATATPANFIIGPVSIGRNAASPKFVTLTPNAAQASDYTITFPPALPASTDYATLDNTGALSFNSSGSTGSGAVVLATSPTLSGTVSGNLTFAGLLKANDGLQNTANTNAVVSTSIALTVTDNPHQVYTTLSGATTVNLPTTGVLKGDVWTIESSVTSQLLTVRASDSSNFTTIRTAIKASTAQPVGRVVVRAKINTPVASTDWDVMEVVDAEIWSGTTSGTGTLAFQISMTRYNSTVTINARTDGGTITGNNLTIPNVPNRIVPTVNQIWAPVVMTSNDRAQSGIVQIDTGNEFTFWLYDTQAFSGSTSGVGGIVGPGNPSGTSFIYNVYTGY